MHALSLLCKIKIKSLKTKLFISSIFSLLDTDTMNDEYSHICHLTNLSAGLYLCLICLVV